jgi:hypothetical protein
MPSRPLTLLRRLLRFSLRTLLLAVLVIGVMLGGYVNRVRRQQAAIAAIEKFGGGAMYDYEIKNDWYDANGESSVADWLRNRVADDYFHSIKLVVFGPSTDLQESLRVEVEAADEVLRSLEGLPRLELLYTTKVPVSDEGMSYIGKLQCLQKLIIEDSSNVTDTGVAHLAGCRQLEALELSGDSQISDEGLRVISQLPRLKYLYLADNRCTDRGLAHIGQMRQLTALYLHYSNITDDGLAHVASLTELETLSLRDAQVTNAGLRRLSGLKNLVTLSLERTQVSDVSELSAALPKCTIFSDKPSP